MRLVEPSAMMTGMAKDKSLKEAIHDELAKFYVGQLQPDLKVLQKEMRQGFEQVMIVVNKLAAGQTDLKRQGDDLKADVALTPERKEVANLKRRVERLETLQSN